MRPESSFEALSERALEGVATPDDRAKLESMLANDPSLREQHELAAEAVNALRSARLEPPPQSLKSDVMRAVRTHVVAGAKLRRLPRSNWLQMLLPAAAGIAAGVLLWGGLTGTLRLDDGAGTSGTMGAAAPAERLVVGDADHGFSLRAGRTEMRLEARGEIAHIRLASPDGALAFGPAPGQPQLEITVPPGAPVTVRIWRRSPNPPLQVIVDRGGPAEPIRIML